MKITEETLYTIEKLAKLTVSDAEREATKAKITGVLDMLDSVDMDNIVNLEPLHHPLEISQPLRSDDPNAEIDRSALQEGAPLVERGLFLVPKVIE